MSELDLSGLDILLVEDDVMLRKREASLLERLGAEVRYRVEHIDLPVLPTVRVEKDRCDEEEHDQHRAEPPGRRFRPAAWRARSRPCAWAPRITW